MHVQSVQKYCFSLANMQICGVFLAVVGCLSSLICFSKTYIKILQGGIYLKSKTSWIIHGIPKFKDEKKRKQTTKAKKTILTRNTWLDSNKKQLTSEHNRFNLNETDELCTNVHGISISFFLLSAAMAGCDFAWNTERPFVLSEINHNVCIPSPVLLWPPSLFQEPGGVFEGQSSSISSQRGGGGGANRGGPLGGMGPREENNSW